MHTHFVSMMANQAVWQNTVPLVAVLAGILGISVKFRKVSAAFARESGSARITVIIVIVALLAAGIVYKLGSGGGSMVNNKSTFQGRVIILGFDGMSANIVDSMLAKGKLPNFAKLKEQGCFRHMQTTNPAQSPVAWTGFSTGQNGGKTGVFDFIKRDPKGYKLSLATADIEGGKAQPVVKSKRFWEYAADKGVPSCILACPVTFPPDKVDGNRMISGMGVPDILGTEGTFSFYTSDDLPVTKDTGGKVFHVDSNSTMQMDLIGPLRKAAGQIDNVKVPITVTKESDGQSVKVTLQGNTFELKQGEWSGWKDISFTMGLFNKMKGIFKMYLVEASPGFKLYVSPINMDPRAPAMTISYPDGYAKELAEDCGLFHTQGMPCDTWALNEKRLDEKAFIEHMDDILGEKKKELSFEMNRTSAGILYVYFETSDTVQHMFWRYTDPESPLYEKDSPYKDMIEKWYEKMDAIVGDTMAKLKPNDTLMVMSDHGFEAFRRSIHVNSWLRQNGYLQLKDPSAPSGGDLLEDVDWSNTKAYALGFGGIFINLQGREEGGIVNPGPEEESLKKEIQTKLMAWEDPKNHAKIIKNVYLGQDIFKGQFAKDAPDLYIGFNAGFRASWQTALGNCPDKLIEDNEKKWSGDHLIDPSLVPAILFCNKKLNENASIYDLAPTILKIIGYNDEELKKFDFDGKPLL